MNSAHSPASPRILSAWLFLVMGLVVAMIVLGGATRLTNSGLSITEWKPITGALPPLSDAQWLSEFDKYKQIPEFEAEHPDMDLEGFKFIYFWEWAHRQLGRLIGLAYGLPFLFWAFRRRLPRGRGIQLFSILALIGVQGAVGWWMVSSGLVNDRVDVSQYRLATHLGLAFVILALLFWAWCDARNRWERPRPDSVLFKSSAILSGLIFLQIILGAFVAGTHAGDTYNTWPMMDGDFVPNGYGMLSPFWRNMTENVAAIQFNHRFLAYIIVAALLILAWRSRNVQRLRVWVWILAGLTALQILLGIWTLLAVAPLSLSLKHQFLAVFVFLASLMVTRRARYPA